MNICQQVSVSFVPSQFWSQITPGPYLIITLFQFLRVTSHCVSVIWIGEVNITQHNHPSDWSATCFDLNWSLVMIYFSLKHVANQLEKYTLLSDKHSCVDFTYSYCFIFLFLCPRSYGMSFLVGLTVPQRVSFCIVEVSNLSGEEKNCLCTLCDHICRFS
jgi:hypothetical protein